MFKPTQINKSPNGRTENDGISAAGHKILHDLHDLKDDAQTLKHDIKGAVRTAKNSARQSGAHVRESAEAVLHAPGSFIHTVRNKPVQSTLIALAVGLLIGKLYRR